MRKFWKYIHSPRNLIVFDAAARLGSFTLAAKEMNMQQPSVSAAIKQLEQALGAQLFTRGHRKIELTAAGNRLFSDISRALDEMEKSVEAVRSMSGGGHVTISSSSAFSYYWLMPRLSGLHSKHPGIDLRLQNSDKEPDLDTENISLGIRRGDGSWPGLHSAKIADEVIMPVASPKVMSAAKRLRSVPSLLQERLIHLEEPVRERPTWEQWFAYHDVTGFKLKGGLRLNDYALVLQAAIAGEGFAFGWDHTIRGLLENGLLVAREDWSWRTGLGFYLTWSANKPLSDQAILVRDWIISEADLPSDTKTNSD